MVEQPTASGWTALRDKLAELGEGELEGFMQPGEPTPSPREQANTEAEAWAASEKAYYASIRRSNATAWEAFYQRVAAFHRHSARAAERKADEAAWLAKSVGSGESP